MVIDATAFRLSEHGLVVRGASPAEAAGRCGVQNTPPGSARVALLARVWDTGGLDAALETEKSLLQAFAARGAPHVFPTRNAGIFTLGLLPHGEDALRGYLSGAQQGPTRSR